jgi:hypothetical protein
VRRDDRASVTRRAFQRDGALAWLVAIAGCALPGCRGAAPRASQTQPRPAASRSDVHAVSTALPLAHASAFELVATSEGAVLVWAPPAACRSGLRVLRLAADGSMPEPAVAVSAVCGGADTDVMELTAAAGGGRLGVALIVEDKARGEARVLGTQASDSAHAFAPIVQLGAAEPNGRAERGRLELVGSESGQLRVTWHAPRAACAGESGSCAQLVSEPYPPAAQAAGRLTDTREIPQPCPRLLMGAVWTDGVWYDAFCALAAPSRAADYDVAAGPRFTHVYAIRPEISYAEADPTLQDCEPLGLAPSRTGAIVWGRCSDGLRAQMLAPDGRRQTISGTTRSVECADGRPVLRLRGANGPGATFPLDAPRDRLELWLPPELASPDSRAAFTGRHLLVATPEAGGLVVHSHHCDTQGLVSVVSDPRPML